MNTPGLKQRDKENADRHTSMLSKLLGSLGPDDYIRVKFWLFEMEAKKGKYDNKETKEKTSYDN